MIFLTILLLFVLLFLGVPVFVSLAACAFIGFAIYQDVPVQILAQRMFSGIDKFSLLAIPFFILGANVMSQGGIAARILRLAQTIVGSFRGGLAYSTQLASMFFGAVSGSSPATVVAIGKMMYPAMVEKKYNDSFSIGLVTASGSVALLIPPSISAIVYGSVTGVSVGALFIAGFGAGILYGVFYLIYIYYFCRKYNVPTDRRSSLSEIWKATKEASWALGVPFIIIGGIYGGVFTPTESSAIAAVYAIIIGMFVYKELSFKELYQVLVESVRSTSQIMLLLASASVLSYILTQGQVPQMLSQAIGSDISPFMFLLIVNIILLIAGMFIDGSSAIIILAPFLYPIALNLGIDPIHLGIVMVANAAIGMFTPPFGLNLFVAQSELKLPLLKIVRGVVPFVFISIAALIVITYIPDISLFLPRMVYDL
jgi:C4-dicarboxylate transporter DctM subunit